MKELEIDWAALKRAQDDWEMKTPAKYAMDLGNYKKFMLEEYGIVHSTTNIRVVDEKKYMMFILRWS